jgi:hypothetical protein
MRVVKYLSPLNASRMNRVAVRAPNAAPLHYVIIAWTLPVGARLNLQKDHARLRLRRLESTNAATSDATRIPAITTPPQFTRRDSTHMVNSK